jgi:hypothetical protein
MHIWIIKEKWKKKEKNHHKNGAGKKKKKIKVCDLETVNIQDILKRDFYKFKEIPKYITSSSDKVITKEIIIIFKKFLLLINKKLL